MSFGQFVMNGGHATIIASKETCNYYRKLYKEFYKAGFSTTHPKVVLFEIDDTKFLKGNFKIKDGKEEKLVKGEYFWAQSKDGKWEFNYPDFLKSFFENGEKRMFDLIIANPPYGKQCSLAKPIIKKILEAAPIAVVLCETIGFTQDEGIMHKISHLEKIPNPFTDALIQNLAIAKLERAANNVEFSRESFTLDDKRYQLAQAIKSYNKTHTRSWENIAYFNTKESKKLSECKTYANVLTDAPCKDLFENNQVFVYTIRVAGDGVHSDGDDTKVNNLEKAAWINPHKRYFDAFVFATPLEKLNFKDWWNSCIKNTGKKSRKGLTNTILSIICECVSGGAGVEAYKTYFPNLDWSRSWTDEEILKELGLPEDFLEKKE
jgi:hypothetical protein